MLKTLSFPALDHAVHAAGVEPTAAEAEAQARPVVRCNSRDAHGAPPDVDLSVAPRAHADAVVVALRHENGAQHLLGPGAVGELAVAPVAAHEHVPAWPPRERPELDVALAAGREVVRELALAAAAGVLDGLARGHEPGRPGEVEDLRRRPLLPRHLHHELRPLAAADRPNHDGVLVVAADGGDHGAVVGERGRADHALELALLVSHAEQLHTLAAAAADARREHHPDADVRPGADLPRDAEREVIRVEAGRGGVALEILEHVRVQHVVAVDGVGR
mmetsp:Transcript_20952/g.63839  ORF Transcript_20952/g.63839 Transcript_20952/m.63839 type:complete len:276 (+) Transcript_20952:1343-2170(+)